MTSFPGSPIITRVNRSHPLAYGLKGWWLSSFGYTGAYWKDLTGLATAVSKGRTIASGFNAPRAVSHSPGHVPNSCYLSSTGSTEFYWDTGLLTLNSVSAYTYSFWARRRSTGEFIQVGASHASSGRNTLLIHSADTTYLTWGTSYTTGSFASSDVEWHHWTVVYDGTVGGGTCTAYKDGVSFISHASSGATTTSNGGNTFIFGKEINAGYVSNGFINDIKVYNRALSSAEVASLYNNSRNGYRGLLAATPQVFDAAKVLTPPTILSVTPPANGAYSFGQSLDFVVEYSEPVEFINIDIGHVDLIIAMDNVNGTGPGFVSALLVSGSGTSTLTFRYNVAENDRDLTGLSVSSPLIVQAANFQSVATGINASLSFAPPDVSGVTITAQPPGSNGIANRRQLLKP